MGNLKTLLSRNIEEVIVKKHLEERLKKGDKLRIKLGADPTAPDLHLGHAVVLWKLKEFQDLGHQIIFIIGDFTAKIGDPSGRSKTRPPLSDQEIKKNGQTYFKQVGKILDTKKIEIVYNSRWFSKMKFSDLLKLTARFSLWRILERDDFENRRKGKKELLVHEILYPIMQAYDSIQIRADVEIGGTDQKFNMLAGRDLQRKMGFPEQDVITCPLLVGIDGKQKMSKSLGNYIALDDEPDQMYGKIMSIPDNLILPYFKLTTPLEEKEIEEIEKALKKGENPRNLKAKLAYEVVKLYHGSKKANFAQEEFDRVFKKQQLPQKIKSFRILPDRKKFLEINPLDLLIKVKFASSKSEARRLIEQKAVKLNKKIIEDWKNKIKLVENSVLQVGKRKVIRII